MSVGMLSGWVVVNEERVQAGDSDKVGSTFIISDWRCSDGISQRADLDPRG